MRWSTCLALVIITVKWNGDPLQLKLSELPSITQLVKHLHNPPEILLGNLINLHWRGRENQRALSGAMIEVVIAININP